MYLIAGSIRSFEFGRRWGCTDARMKGTGLFFPLVVLVEPSGDRQKTVRMWSKVSIGYPLSCCCCETTTLSAIGETWVWPPRHKPSRDSQVIAQVCFDAYQHPTPSVSHTRC